MDGRLPDTRDLFESEEVTGAPVVDGRPLLPLRLLLSSLLFRSLFLVPPDDTRRQRSK